MIGGKHHKRTIKLAISNDTRKAVTKRDGGMCIFCGHPGNPEAHFISRAQGGLGIPENILTVCRPCHNLLDHPQQIKGEKDTNTRVVMLKIAEAYLRDHYPGWNKEDLIFKKYPF